MPVGSIVELRADDLAQLENLLSRNNLPAEDCAEAARFFCGIFDGADLVAAGGLETAANDALLRSVVVDPRYRARGLATRITEFLVTQAENDGRDAVYLLTDTAEGFFEKLGFVRIDRASAPPAIAQTRQFRLLCPQTASCLKRANSV